MGKRFTDTDKFSKQWYKKLSPEYKCLWEYILTQCDSAGVWIIENDVASMRIGRKVDLEEALKLYNEDKLRVAVFHNKERWLIVDFINFQYGSLCAKHLECKAPGVKTGVVKALYAHNLIEFYDFEQGDFSQKLLIEKFGKDSELNNTLFQTQEYSIPESKIEYSEVENTLKDKDIYKEKEKEKKEIKEQDPKVTVTMPRSAQDRMRLEIDDEISPEYAEIFDLWLQYKKERRESYKSTRSLKTAYKQLVNLSDGNPEVARSIVNQSIANNWAGIFEPKGILNRNGAATNLEQRAAAAAAVYQKIGNQQIPVFGDD